MTTDYTEQTWHDDDPATPVSAARLGHIEDGIKNHGHPDIEAEIAAGGGGGGGGGGGAIAAASLWVAGGLETLSSGGWASNPLTSLSDDSGGADLSWDVSDPQRIIVHTPGVYAITLYFRSSAVPASQKARLTISSSTPHVDDIADERAFGTDAGTVYAALTYIVPMPADALTEVGGTGWLYANVGLAGADLANSSMEIIVTKLVGVLAGGGGGTPAPETMKALIVNNGGADYTGLAGTSDGLFWQRLAGPWPGGNNTSYHSVLAHNGTEWMMVNDTGNGASAVATSPNGIFWTQRNSPFATFGTGGVSDFGVAKAVCWDATNSRWLVFGTLHDGSEVVTTTADSGVTWSTPVVLSDPFPYIEITHAFEHAGTIIAVCGNASSYSDPVTGDYKAVFRSTDGGATWAVIGLTDVGDGQPENNLSEIYQVVFLNDRWFILTDPGNGVGIYTSVDDGLTWAQITGTGTSTFGYRNIGWDGTKYLAGADLTSDHGADALLESTDGDTWVGVADPGLGVINNGTVGGPRRFAWIGDRYIATGPANAGVSFDGHVWSPAFIPFYDGIANHVGEIVGAR